MRATQEPHISEIEQAHQNQRRRDAGGEEQQFASEYPHPKFSHKKAQKAQMGFPDLCA